MLKVFERLVDPLAPYPHRDTPPTRLWPFILSFSGPLKRAIALAAILSVVTALVEVLTLHFLGQVVDVLSTVSPDQVWAQYGVWLVALGLFILLIRPLFQILSVGVMFISVLGNIATVVRWRSHRHVARQSIGWFENDFAGRIANRISQTPNAIEEVAGMLLEAIAYAASYTIAAFVLLWYADPRLMVPMVVWLACYGVLLRATVRLVTPASEAHSAARTLFTGRIVDGYTNIHALKMFAHHDREEAYVRDAVEQVRDAKVREMGVFARLEIWLVILNGILIVSVVGMAIYLWSGGLASVGIVAAASALVLRLNAMTGWIMWAVSNLFSNLGVVQEGMETIAQPITLRDADNAAPLRVSNAEICFEDVHHHYGRDRGGLDGVSLTVRPGEKIGLVGSSGAGKSTLVKLLLRFYDVEKGQIRIDDQPIGQVTQESLRRHVGMVQQDSALLHRSIRDNLLYGRPDASEEDMIAAAKRAEAHDFITDLQDSDGLSGYDALVGERGVKLSGGQRQRIALARVILKDAPILVLDEATSALDSEVEAQIQSALRAAMEGKTVIAIAHRLSTLADMDRIVVLDDGRIVESGPHKELLARDGLYARYWNRQSGGFIGSDS